MIQESWSNLRLTIYLGEKDTFNGKPLYKIIVHKLKEKGIIGATATRGIYGYGRKSHIHSAGVLEVSGNLPIIIESIDDGKKIQQAMEEIKPLIKEGLITIEPVTVVFITPNETEKK